MSDRRVNLSIVSVTTTSDNMNEQKAMLCTLREQLAQTGASIRERIAEKRLYLRISVVGSCNLSCPFCHNEGAPKTGRMELEELEEITAAGEAVGFTRVQFTGGEPLLHPQIVQFVSTVRSRFDDVGITTNGVYLSSKITELASVGLNRLHVSLMVEPLQDAGTSPGEWGVPKWVERICEICASKGIALRFNLPVPRNHFHNASAFMARMRSHAAQLKVFSMLPEGACREEEFPIELLRDIVNRENSERVTLGLDTRVELRDYRPPVGIRCRCCQDYEACKEQSHSLRVGSDKVLRPCLATRQWDIPLGKLENLAEHIEAATLFALDY